MSCANGQSARRCALFVFFVIVFEICCDDEEEDFGPCGPIWKPLCPGELQPSKLFMLHRYISVGLDLIKTSGRYYYEVFPGPGIKALFAGWASVGYKDEEDSPCTGIGLRGGGFSVNVEYQMKVANGRFRKVRFGTFQRETLMGATIGCAINFDTFMVEFSVNGEWIPDARMNFSTAGSEEMLEYGYFPAVTSSGVFHFTLGGFKYAPPDSSYTSLILGAEDRLGGQKVKHCRWPPPVKVGPCPNNIEDMSEQLQSDFQAYSDMLQVLHPKYCNKGPDVCSPEGILDEQYNAWSGVRGRHNFNVLCEGDRITRLYLSDMKMKGRIPSFIDRLDGLRGLYCSGNQLRGKLPDTLSNLQALEHFTSISNRLTGTIPTQLGRMTNLHLLDLSDNSLNGSLPQELGNMISLKRLRFRANKLQGTLPSQLGQLSNLQKIDIGENLITGSVPSEIGNLHALKDLEMYSLRLRGRIPSEIGRLENLNKFRLGDNMLEGTLPTELGQLTRLKILEADKNMLTGSIPEIFSEMKLLKIINLAQNALTGPIPTGLGECPELYFVYLSRNQLTGDLPENLGNLQHLRYLWLGSMTHRASFSGRVLGGFKGFIPNSFGHLRKLQSLDLSKNKLRGTIPASLFLGTQLSTLFLHRNKLTGALPSTIGNLRTLESLMLHSNRLSGSFPSELSRLSGLRTLTAHDNLIDGHLPPLSLVPRANAFEDDHKHILTLYGNKLSCKLPEVQQAGFQESLNSVVVLGNMFDGPLPGWVDDAEKQSELLYNETPGRDVQNWVLCVVLGCFTFMVVTWLLFGAAQGQQAFLACVGQIDAETSIGSIFQNLLRCCAVLATPAVILMFVYASHHDFYECGRILPRVSLAYFKGSHAADWCVVVVWCIWLSMVAAFAYCAPYLQAKVLEKREEEVFLWGSESEKVPRVTRRICVGWTLVCITLLLLALPSALFVMIHTMPNDNIFLKFGLTRKWRKLLHVACPLLQSSFDSMLAPPIFKMYHDNFQISDLKMLIILRMMSGWVVFVVLGVATHHTCIAGWKYFWSVCTVPHPNEFDTNWVLQNPFDASEGDLTVKLISTERDICRSGSLGDWWKRSLCDRSVLEHLATFVSQRLIVATAVQSISYLVRWRRWQREPYALVQRQARIIPFVLQVAIIWVPFAPLLLPLVVTAILAQGIVYDLCCPRATEKIKDDRLKEACFMLEFLRVNVAVCAILMARFSWVSHMSGRFFMCFFVILILIFLRVSVGRYPPAWCRGLFGWLTGKFFDTSERRRVGSRLGKSIELAERPAIDRRPDISTMATPVMEMEATETW